MPLRNFVREPHEDHRRVFDHCATCGDEIYEFDDCYDIPSFGCVCERCIKKYKKVEVTLD